MTVAAKQLREYIEWRWPGIRISRQSCRLTVKGRISQHSAYGYGTTSPEDSNALDIMGAAIDESLTASEQKALNIRVIQEVVAYLDDHREEWSIRQIVWEEPGHYGHAHVDFYPYIFYPVQWCMHPRWIPSWRRSDGSTLATKNPEPQNGRYNGLEEEVLMPEQQWEQMIDALFEGRPDEFQGNPEYWKNLPPDHPEWKDFWAAFVRVIS